MDLSTAKEAFSLIEEGACFAWLTIIDNHGSAPRHTGSSMLVRSDGSTVGTIGGGPLEAAAVAEALKALQERRSRQMDYNLSGAESANLGMICGGNGVVLVDFVEPKDQAVAQYFSGLCHLLAEGGRGWAVVTVPSASGGRWTARKCLVTANGQVSGEASGHGVDVHNLSSLAHASKHVVSTETGATYVWPVGRQSAAYVFGAGHCAHKLVPLLSSVGFYTIVIDDRADFANAERFPSADRIVVPPSFAGVMEQLPVDSDSYLVIVTRGHLHDKTVLQQTLATDAAYIGMIGSKKKIADIFSALQEEGVTPEQLSRVYAPIGLPIGAETPEEIAVSIAAQLIQVRAARQA